MVLKKFLKKILIQLVTKFYSNLYNAPEVLEQEIPHINGSNPKILMEEVETALKHMKNGKAARWNCWILPEGEHGKS